MHPSSKAVRSNQALGWCDWSSHVSLSMSFSMMCIPKPHTVTPANKRPTRYLTDTHIHIHIYRDRYSNTCMHRIILSHTHTYTHKWPLFRYSLCVNWDATPTSGATQLMPVYARVCASKRWKKRKRERESKTEGDSKNILHRFPAVMHFRFNNVGHRDAPFSLLHTHILRSKSFRNRTRTKKQGGNRFEKLSP